MVAALAVAGLVVAGSTLADEPSRPPGGVVIQPVPPAGAPVPGGRDADEPVPDVRPPVAQDAGGHLAAGQGGPPPVQPGAGKQGVRAKSEHTDERAAAYFTERWGNSDKAAKRLKDIRTVGGYLRIYTDLPESAGDSSQAITLCERGLEYLRERGVAVPVVFVQAKFGENGNPVLANILGPDDETCKVTHPEPG